jgi:transcriptional regulator with XRE-family HTH domain
MDMSTDLGQRLKAARTVRGLSLDAVGREAKVSQGYLHKLEAGRVANPSPRVLQRLSAVLDIPYRDLMDLAGYLMPDEDNAQGRSVARPSTATNAQLLGHVEALRADVADLRAVQRRILEAVEGRRNPQ